MVAEGLSPTTSSHVSSLPTQWVQALAMCLGSSLQAPESPGPCTMRIATTLPACALIFSAMPHSTAPPPSRPNLHRGLATGR